VSGKWLLAGFLHRHGFGPQNPGFHSMVDWAGAKSTSILTTLSWGGPKQPRCPGPVTDPALGAALQCMIDGTGESHQG